MEVVVPLGAILIPDGSNVKDGRVARVVASTGEDVAPDDVDSGPERPLVDVGVGRKVVRLIRLVDIPDDLPVVGSAPVTNGGKLELLVYESELLAATFPPELVPENAAASEPVPPVRIVRPMLDPDIETADPSPVLIVIELDWDPDTWVLAMLCPLAARVGTTPVATLERFKAVATEFTPEGRPIFDIDTVGPCHL